jgi:hypothetical protein
MGKGLVFLGSLFLIFMCLGGFSKNKHVSNIKLVQTNKKIVATKVKKECNGYKNDGTYLAISNTNSNFADWQKENSILQSGKWIVNKGDHCYMSSAGEDDHNINLTSVSVRKDKITLYLSKHNVVEQFHLSVDDGDYGKQFSKEDLVKIKEDDKYGNYTLPNDLLPFLKSGSKLQITVMVMYHYPLCAYETHNYELDLKGFTRAFKALSSSKCLSH